MPVSESESLTIHEEPDIVQARQTVRSLAKKLGFSLVDQTKLVTAASELARNVVVHGGGGTCRIEVLREAQRIGLQLTFEDQGPGIRDISRALEDGFSTGGGLGLGLGGTRRLVNQFSIESQPGKGTCVTIARWT
jgi:serine/threonine-protein kinase RsbT